ncbi:hypothetical protein PP460_gp022 [Streptomyces phage Muntaha]|uniref:Uncharacterized protein n=1 Tax=Streptomyces phage Muntaha TaxID=2713269 RepID=A0A6G8R3K2_9CAUD|nr:hypothetical protein PP460_gp022 [Streptomyces phage Muntaha]QIN94780.1 hypothetical protein SEA_MUNTAHA_257 [Streptomyces phage Muntaha]
MQLTIRRVTVSGRSGIAAGRRFNKDGSVSKVFVLFDGDNAAESSADWFPADSVAFVSSQWLNA